MAIGVACGVVTNEYDPHSLARRHYRENLWLRSLVTGVPGSWSQGCEYVLG